MLLGIGSSKLNHNKTNKENKKKDSGCNAPILITWSPLSQILMSRSGLEGVRVTLQSQVVHRNTLAVACQQNSLVLKQTVAQQMRSQEGRCVMLAKHKMAVTVCNFVLETNSISGGS